MPRRPSRDRKPLGNIGKATERGRSDLRRSQTYEPWASITGMASTMPRRHSFRFEADVHDQRLSSEGPTPLTLARLLHVVEVHDATGPKIRLRLVGHLDLES